MSDWLLPLRSGENEEARYSIRSWIANAGMAESDRLVTVGDVPPWLEPDEHIPGNKARSGPVNVYANIRDACGSGLLSERVIVTNDDMIALGLVDVEQVCYRSTLNEHLARLPNRSTWWFASLRITAATLRRRGVTHALSYELHRPLPVETERMASILADCWTGLGIPPQFRSLYGNIAEIGGAQAKDGKVVTRANWPIDGPWLSTTDGSWRWLAPEMIERFPKPSRFEQS